MREAKKKQRKFYSGKKKRHTLKTQVVEEKANRKIICVSCCEGKKHDYQLFKDSGVRLNEQTEQIMDSGYQGAQRTHARTVLPQKKPRGGVLAKYQKCLNRQIARQRVLNENVIGSIKRFRILAERYRNRRKRYHLRVTLIAVIYNKEIE